MPDRAQVPPEPEGLEERADATEGTLLDFLYDKTIYSLLHVFQESRSLYPLMGQWMGQPVLQLYKLN